MFKTKFLICATLPYLLCCSHEQSTTTGNQALRIYAAASLSNVLPQIAEAFQHENPDAKLEFNFAASSLLAKQIQHAAPADVYISANVQWVKYLQEKNLVEQNSSVNFLSNKLVLVAPLESDFSFEQTKDLTNPAVRQIAMADWSHVPAGIYAKQALQKLGIWRQIQEKCVPALDVRTALVYVERKEVDFGIVFRTDASISKKVEIVHQFPEEVQPDIQYGMTVTRNSKHPLSALFFEFLVSEPANRIFSEHGFIVPDSNKVPK